MIYDTEIEKTLKNLKNNTGFLKTNEDLQRGWIWNGYPIKILGGTEVQINDNILKKSPGIQKIIVDLTYKIAKSMNDKEKVVFGDMSQKTIHYDHIPTKGRMSGRDKYI